MAHERRTSFDPLGDNAGLGEAPDEATDDMRATVREWVWYGYYAAEAIMRWIDEGAAEGEEFDLEDIKAFATATLEKKRAAEAQWPQLTDCDRLDEAFGKLNEQGLCVLQCAGNTMSDGQEEVSQILDAEDAEPGRYQGYCFFHSQDIDRALYGDGLMLAFGAANPRDRDGAVRVGQMVIEALAQQGLQARWDGRAGNRIEVPALRWQRRTPTLD